MFGQGLGCRIDGPHLEFREDTIDSLAGMGCIIESVGADGPSPGLEDDGPSWMLVDVRCDIVDTVVDDDPTVVGLVVLVDLLIRD